MHLDKQLLSRRSLLVGGATLATIGGGARLIIGQQAGMPDGTAAKGMVTPATERAIEHGLDYLVRNQHPDGSFGTGPQYRGNVAITALGGLAMMAGGFVPGRGKYGDVVRRALDFILSQEKNDPPGYLHNAAAAAHGPMYGHGFATLFLAEVQGMVHERALRERLHACLDRSVRLIIRSQNQKGGWRYHPHSTDADLSVTICQIMALRSAKNAGFYVPKSVADRCIAYVKRCRDPHGGFRYMDSHGGPAFARTAAGVVALYSAGLYKGPEVEDGLRYLQSCKPGNQFLRHDMHYFYGHYYAAQAMWTAGGKYWQEWYPAIRDDLLNSPRLRPDGAWFDPICTHYGTAMACIILQIPNNYLPILQK